MNKKEKTPLKPPPVTLNSLELERGEELVLSWIDKLILYSFPPIVIILFVICMLKVIIN